MNSQKFRKRKNAIIDNMNNLIVDSEQGYTEATRVCNIVENTLPILNHLDDEFVRQTGLTKLDTQILFTAIGLQIIRQYVLTKFPQRLDDQTAAKKTPGHQEEHSNRQHRYYNPSLEEIITNPVPFDASIGSNGALKGGGHLGHRATAIGHDPVLGLIFGTANIATATLTTSSFDSYHIGTNEFKRDFFKNKAKTELVLKNTMDKLLYGGQEGKLIVGTSLMKEIVHLRSDVHTKNSLPLPFISAIDPKLASNLASYGLDMSNILTVSKQATYAMFINSLIAMLHGLFYDGIEDKKLYQVRTKKILVYSDIISSSSNLSVSLITKNIDYADLGGWACTISNLATSSKFIHSVKQEFIFGSYRELILGKD